MTRSKAKKVALKSVLNGTFTAYEARYCEVRSEEFLIVYPPQNEQGAAVNDYGMIAEWNPSMEKMVELQKTKPSSRLYRCRVTLERIR